MQVWVATALSEPPACLKVPTRGETPKDVAAVKEFDKLLSAELFAPISCVVDVGKTGNLTFRSVTVSK